MGVVRVWLHDDPTVPSTALSPTNAVPSMLDQDPAVLGGSVNHRLLVRLRVRSGFDENGVPQFDWSDLVEGESILFEEREEFDSDAGLVLIKAVAVILYTGDVVVPETAVIVRDDGVRYRVLAVDQVPGRLRFGLERIAQ